jgi:hypothetical protein
MMAMKNGLYDANRYVVYNDEGILHTVDADIICLIMDISSGQR